MPSGTDLIGKKIRSIRESMMETFGPSDYKAKKYNASSAEDMIWKELSFLDEAIRTLQPGGKVPHNDLLGRGEAGAHPASAIDGVVKQLSEDIQQLDTSLQFNKENKIYGTSSAGVRSKLFSISDRVYRGELIDQVEVGTKKLHLHFGTNDDPEFGQHITYETPSGTKIIPAAVDFLPKSKWIIDPKYDGNISSNGSSLAPFKTWDECAAAIDDFYGEETPHDFIVEIATGSDLSGADIIMSNSHDFIIMAAASAPDHPTVIIGNLNLSENVFNGTFLGIRFIGNMVINTNNSSEEFPDEIGYVFQNCQVDYGFTATDSSGKYITLSFEDVCFQSDFAIMDPFIGEVGFYSCWTYTKSDETTVNMFAQTVQDFPVFTFSSPDVNAFFSSCIDIHAHRVQGNFAIRASDMVPSVSGSPDYSFVSESTVGEIYLCFGNARPYLGGPLYGVNIKGTATFYTIAYEFERSKSILAGPYGGGGEGSAEIRDNDTRPGYTAVIFSNDTYGYRQFANTVKDQLNGISNGLLKANTIHPEDKFITTDIVINSDGTYSSGGRWVHAGLNLSGTKIQLTGRDGIVVGEIDISSVSAGLVDITVGINPTGNIPSLIFELSNGNFTYLPLSALSQFKSSATITIQDDGTLVVNIDTANSALYANSNGISLGAATATKFGGVKSSTSALSGAVDENGIITTNGLVEALQEKVDKDGAKILTTVDFTTELALWIAGQVTIISVVNANKLSLRNGVLKMDSEIINVLEYMALDDKSGTWDIWWDDTVSAQVAAANALFGQVKSASVSDIQNLRSEINASLVGVTKHLIKKVSSGSVSAGGTSFTFTFTDAEKTILTGKTILSKTIKCLDNGSRIYPPGGTYGSASYSVTWATYTLTGTNTISHYSSSTDSWSGYSYIIDVEYA